MTSISVRPVGAATLDASPDWLTTVIFGMGGNPLDWPDGLAGMSPGLLLAGKRFCKADEWD
jgi:hypothetical protein